MQNETLLIIFIAVTAAAVVVQVCLLAATYVSARKTSQRMEALATEVKDHALPMLQTAHSLLVDLRPKVEIIAENLSRSTTLMRAQVERLDVTVGDMIDRTRLQVIRADELVSRTMNRVEETSDLVNKTVVSPLRQIAALMQGVVVGLETLLGRRRRESRDGVGVPQDEMFI